MERMKNRGGFGGFNKESCIALSIKEDDTVTDIDHPIREKKKEGCILCRALELAALGWAGCWLVHKKKRNAKQASAGKQATGQRTEKATFNFLFFYA
jgi:hypothetical protein